MGHIDGTSLEGYCDGNCDGISVEGLIDGKLEGWSNVGWEVGSSVEGSGEGC